MFGKLPQTRRLWKRVCDGNLVSTLYYGLPLLWFDLHSTNSYPKLYSTPICAQPGQ